MKKKMLAMLLACMMIVPASAFSVMAEETTEAAEEASGETAELNWSDVEADVEEAGLEGEFYSIAETGLMMWIPSTLTEAELTDEDTEEGYIAYLTNEDESYAVLIQALSDSGITAEEFADSMADSVSEVEVMTINGLTAAGFMDAENEALGVAVETEDGSLVAFYFAPESEDEYSTEASLMMMSIQTYDETAEDAAEEAVEEETTEAE